MSTRIGNVVTLGNGERIKLKPCPFCGADAEAVSTDFSEPAVEMHPGFVWHRRHFVVACTRYACGARMHTEWNPDHGGDDYQRGTVLDRWNRRPKRDEVTCKRCLARKEKA